MESKPERMKAMRWESQETITTIRDATPTESETKSIICGSQEFIIANPGAPFPDTDEKNTVREPAEAIIRNGDAPFDPDALDIDLEKLGRQRPKCLPSALRELAFCTAILTSMVMAVSSLFPLLPHDFSPPPSHPRLTQLRNTLSPVPTSSSPPSPNPSRSPRPPRHGSPRSSPSPREPPSCP